MADNLKFEIGFDLEKGVQDAIKDGNKALERIAKALEKRPISIKLKIDSGSTKRTSAEMTGFRKQLAELTKEWNTLTAAERGGVAGAAIREKYRVLRQEAQGYTSTLQAAVKAEDKLQNAQNKTAASARNLGKEHQITSSYLSRLIQRMVAYWSVQQVGNFLTNVREVTAEFELQRISLGAIIQDQQRANQLFSEIKSFALKSPLKIMDLTKYTKQVAAYGFETEKLFDTTKMLADISVGLGVDMSRLTLFLGQVFATGYLRASEVRQATEAGIPLVDKLAKKLEELNGRTYTAAEVMDMISKRAISYELVEQVFKDMTSAGGEFYNMQVKQSQTLYGMWSKLGDAAAIMYEQIGNSSVVNATMKTTIRFLELMMRNWQTTGRILSTLTVGIGTYVLMLKNAAVASTAVTVAEGARLAITKSQVIATPKLVAAIIGQNAATKLSATLTKAHTVAMLHQATATNVLSRAFWNLTAAMLANPWALAVAAIVAVGVALFHFIGNAETAAERAEKLNNSVASLKNLDDTTKPLIDAYNDLIKKTERTAEEEKKLSAVTHELAKQYPGAITAVGNFGAEVELAAEKLNQLYQAEKQVRMDNTRYELGETEKKIEKTERKIAQLQKQLSEGKKWGGGQSGVMVAMSDKDKGKILRQINELRYGEDGQSGLLGLQQSADAAREAIEAAMKGITVDKLRIEKFGAWKKKLTEFSKDVGGIKVKLFDDSTISQFGTLEEALDAAAKKYNEATESIEKYNKTLEQGVERLGQEQFDKISAERDMAQATKDLSEEALKYYNAMALVLKAIGSGSRQTDPRLQTLQQIANKMAEVNKEYDELLKKEGQTKALADTQKLFASSFAEMQKVANKYKFKLPAFEVPQTIEDVQKWYQAIIDEINRLGIKNADKVLIELGFKRDKSAIDKQQKDIEAQIKELADRISRTKTAKEFYDKVLGMTGDVQLAAKVSMSIYGSTGHDLQKQLAEQVRQYFQNDKVSIEIPVDVITPDNQINYKKLGEFAEQMKEKLGEEPYKAIKKIAEEGQKDLAKTYEGYLKDLEKAKTYADKRVELARTTAEKIRAINADIAAGNISEDVGKATIQGLQNKEIEDAAKLEYEAFKDTPLYVQMFEDLGQASSYALESMREKLLGLQNVWGSALDPTQLKEIQSRINEIDAQLRVRNPFKTLREAYQQYHDALKNYTVLGAEENVAVAQAAYDQAVEDTGSTDSKEAKAAERTLEIEKRRLEIAKKLTNEKGKALTGQRALDKATQVANEEEARARVELAQALASEEEAKANGGDVEAAHEAVEAAKEKLNLAQATSEIVQEEAKTSKTLKEAWLAAGQTIGNIGASIKEVGQSISSMMEAFGSASAEDIQFVNDISDAIGDIFAGVGDIIQSALSGDVVGIVTGALTAPVKMVTGFVNLFSAGKVRRANKEIKKQQALLDQLEYTYSRLEKAADKAFGSDYINNYQQRMENLQAQAAAYQKQAEAERSKGKKKDNDKIKEYEEAYRDTMDKIADMQSELQEYFAGTDITSAARDFASAWIEAKTSFESTTDAMREKFKDMVQNMIIEAMAAKIMENALQPFYKAIDDAAADGKITADEIAAATRLGLDSIEDMNNGMEVVWAQLQQAGIDTSKLWSDASTEATGIAKNVSSATSEEINANTAALNTQNYYMSHIDENVAAIVQLMRAGTGGDIPVATSAGWTDWQQQAMDAYNAIQRNTADTVVECRRAANACEEAVAKMNRIIKVKGATQGINVFLNS